MNVSQPIASAIDSVDFDFLTPAEIKAISVKRIENPTTFDSLLNPTPAGLYDTALGAWGEVTYVQAAPSACWRCC
jgi:DNA-directed RNA polymerase I subunit RPA1